MAAISFAPFLQTIPWGTRILTLLLFAGSLLHFGLAAIVRKDAPDLPIPGHEAPWLVLVPTISWKFPWTLLTAGWVELHVIEFIISLMTVPMACRYLERLWGIRELLKFSFVVIVGSNVIAFGFFWLVYLATGAEAIVSGEPFHGMSGLQSGILVAFTQIIPEHQLQLGILKTKVKTLPGMFLLLSNILVVILGPSPFILIQFGFFIAWLYLRFFKLSESGEYRGDRSETFAFQYWFPPIIRPYVAAASNQVFRLAVRARVIQPWDETLGLNQYSTLPGPGGARAEAERRRAVALRALDARMASATASTPAVNVGQKSELPKPTSTVTDSQAGNSTHV